MQQSELAYMLQHQHCQAFLQRFYPSLHCACGLIKGSEHSHVTIGSGAGLLLDGHLAARDFLWGNQRLGSARGAVRRIPRHEQRNLHHVSQVCLEPVIPRPDARDGTA